MKSIRKTKSFTVYPILKDVSTCQYSFMNSFSWFVCVESERKKFSIDYDKLVISVGAYSNTFGIPGVKEYGCFLKEVNDARRIRTKLLDCNLYTTQ